MSSEPETTENSKLNAPTEIRLLGQKISLKINSKSNEPDPHLVQDILELVSKKLQDAETKSKSGQAPHQIALLALLDLAEEYVRAKRRTLEYQSAVIEKSERLRGLLEAEWK
jgi:hypothetical protein